MARKTNIDDLTEEISDLEARLQNAKIRLAAASPAPHAQTNGQADGAHEDPSKLKAKPNGMTSLAYREAALAYGRQPTSLTSLLDEHRLTNS